MRATADIGGHTPSASTHCSRDDAEQLFKRLTTAVGHNKRSSLRKKIRLHGKKAVSALQSGLKQRDPYIRWEAINLLGDLALPATSKALLSFALKENETHARWRSFWAVSRLPRDLTIPSLIEMLDDTTWQHRWNAALMLNMMHRGEANSVIEEALEHSDQRVVWEALSAVKAAPHNMFSDAVCRYMAATYPLHLRQEATLALGRIGNSDALTNLIAALTDPIPGIRWRAALSIRRYGRTGIDLLRPYLNTEKDEAVLNTLKEICNESQAFEAVT